MLKLHGHSGCYIEYHTKKVRKGTSENGYVGRLKNQAKKQMEFAELNLDPSTVDVPKVLLCQEGENYFWFEMEYAPGLSGLEFIQYATKGQLEWFITQVIKFIENNVLHSTIVRVEIAPIEEKLSQIAMRTESKAVLLLQNHISRKERYLEIPIGPCHGDLTLSNMIMDLIHHKIWLIDFLDTFLNTPLWDIAKIRQDTTYHWISCCSSGPYDEPKAFIALSHLDAQIHQHFTSYRWYTQHYNMFQAVNLARILPYSKTQQEKQRLEHLIGELVCHD